VEHGRSGTGNQGFERPQKPVGDTLLQYLSPLGREHINLTSDYLWRSSTKVGAGKFRPLRPLLPAERALFSVF